MNDYISFKKSKVSNNKEKTFMHLLRISQRPTYKAIIEVFQIMIDDDNTNNTTHNEETAVLDDIKPIKIQQKHLRYHLMKKPHLKPKQYEEIQAQYHKYKHHMNGCIKSTGQLDKCLKRLIQWGYIKKTTKKKRNNYYALTKKYQQEAIRLFLKKQIEICDIGQFYINDDENLAIKLKRSNRTKLLVSIPTKTFRGYKEIVKILSYGL